MIIFYRRLRGLYRTHSDLQSSGGPPDGLRTTLKRLRHRETTTTSLSENPQVTALPGLGSLTEIGPHSTMGYAGAEW